MQAQKLLLSLRQSRITAVGFIVVVSAVPIGMVLLLNSWKGIPFGNLTRDPTAVSEFPLYTGFFSQLGIFWSAAVAACVLGAMVLAGNRMGNDPARSVVNSALRAHDVDNLFIVSSSVFVTAGAVQPSLTIAALAIRAAGHLASGPTCRTYR